MGLSYGVAQILEVAWHHVGNTRTPHQALNGLRAVLILQNRTYDFNALVVHLQNAGMDLSQLDFNCDACLLFVTDGLIDLQSFTP